MDQIIAIFNQILDFFKNNESLAGIIDMLKNLIGSFLNKEETAE